MYARGYRLRNPQRTVTPGTAFSAFDDQHPSFSFEQPTDGITAEPPKAGQFLGAVVPFKDRARARLAFQNIRDCVDGHFLYASLIVFAVLRLDLGDTLHKPFPRRREESRSTIVCGDREQCRAVP